MAKINLLPWREERRDKLKQVFALTLVVVAVAAIGLILLADGVLYGVRTFHQSKVDGLNTEINIVEKRIKEIDGLKQSRLDLIKRIEVVQGLQNNREVITRIFDQLVMTLPDGVYYTSLKNSGQGINIDAIAENNDLISELMRNIESSDWFLAPNLTTVKKQAQDGGSALQAFNLNVQQTKPNPVKGGAN